MRLYPIDVTIIKNLTDANDHELALWYAAHQIGAVELERELATHVCITQLTGELTPELHMKSRHFRARLHKEMTSEELVRFKSAT